LLRHKGRFEILTNLR